MKIRASALLVLVLSACDRAPSTPPQPAELPSAATPPASPSPAAPASATPPPSAAASSASAAPSSAPSASAQPLASASAAPAPLPKVKVENIGMHIGGGPNDAVNKAPIADSVAPHFDEVRACWAKVDDASRGGDFGVDLLIQPEGGRAKVSNPRTAIRPAAFKDCVVAVFEQVDFKKPLKGLTMVSYSLRFTP